MSLTIPPATSPITPGTVRYAASHAAARGWDAEADVIVVGSGAAALAGAVMARADGASVILIEARDELGGTTARSGGGTWVPNNRFMRARGQEDPRDAALRYMARYSFPQMYDAADPQLGLSANAYDLLCAFFDNATSSVERLEELGAVCFRGDFAYDYWEDAPDNVVSYGRTIFPMRPDDREVQGKIYPAIGSAPAWREVNHTEKSVQIGSGGVLMTGQMGEWLRRHECRFLMEHRAQRLIVNDRREVVGLEAIKPDHSVVTIRAHKAVHFGSGGFAFNAEMRLNFLRGPAFGGCAVPTNRGDFVYMATGAGAKLGNMQNGWNTSVIMDDAFTEPQPIHPVLILGGDSMVVVNKTGRRVGNEKRNYADRLEVQHDYDPVTREWPNLALFIVYDQRTVDLCGGFFPFHSNEDRPEYVISGDTVDDLAANIAERLWAYAPKIGGFTLDAAFASNLRDEISRFNRFAVNGIDEDFGRGSNAYDQQWHQRAFGARLVASNPSPNKTMHPFAEDGRLFAVTLLKGHADTNGGPVINANAQVLDANGAPISGLYGAGNCIASPSGRAYWGGGTTLGLALTFGSIAGRQAAAESPKSLS